MKIKPKTITQIAVKQNGTVYSAPIGKAHDDIRRDNNLKGQAKRGFLASDGGFLNRSEGYEVASQAKQIKQRDRMTDKGILHSHHLKERLKAIMPRNIKIQERHADSTGLRIITKFVQLKEWKTMNQATPTNHASLAAFPKSKAKQTDTAKKPDIRKMKAMGATKPHVYEVYVPDRYLNLSLRPGSIDAFHLPSLIQDQHTPFRTFLKGSV